MFTYSELKKNPPKSSIDRIPKLVFRTSAHSIDKLPEQVQTIYNIDELNNPDYSFYYFDDIDCLRLVLDSNIEGVIPAYDRLLPSAYKCDLWRYIVLYTYGGIYLDFTMHLHPSFNYDKIIGDGKLDIFVKDTLDYGIYNAFICVKPKSEFILKVIKRLIKNTDTKNKGQNPLDVTGPKMMGRVFSEYYLKGGNLSNFNAESNLNKLKMYINLDNMYIINEKGDKVIKNRLKSHYSILYNDNAHNINPYLHPDYRPLSHYSRLWAENKVFKY